MDGATTFVKQLQGDVLVTITLNGTNETFAVQKALLCDASEYFNKALNGGFKEASENVLLVPDCEIEVLHLFIYWLYKGELPDLQGQLATTPTGSQERKQLIEDFQMNIIRLWIFADKYMMPNLQNVAMSSLLNILRFACIRAGAISLAFNNSAEDSKLRAATIHSFLENQEGEGSQNAYGELNYDNEALNLLGGTNGVFPAFLKAVQSSKCRTLPCECEPACYSMAKSRNRRFMVTEEHEE